MFIYIWNSEPWKLFIFWTRICKFQPLLFRYLILKRIPTYKSSHKILKNFEKLNLIFLLKAIPSEYQIHKNNILINQNKIMGSNFALSTLLSVYCLFKYPTETILRHFQGSMIEKELFLQKWFIIDLWQGPKCDALNDLVPFVWVYMRTNTSWHLFTNI